jgi:uncharacterized membrane protein YccC
MGETISALRRQLNILARNTHNPLSPGSPSAAAPDAFTESLTPRSPRRYLLSRSLAVIVAVIVFWYGSESPFYGITTGDLGDV